MSVEMIRSMLLWCTVINYGVLLLWFLMFVFAHDWLYHSHGRFFRLSVEQFDAIHYTGIAFYKLLIIVLNLAPLLALYIVA